MSVKNVSSSQLTGVVLRRQVDFDIDTGGAQGWAGFVQQPQPHPGNRLRVPRPGRGAEREGSARDHAGGPETTGNWYTRVTADILPTGCDPASAPLDANFISQRGDYGDTIGFPIGSIAPGQTKVVSVRYMRY